MHRDQFLCILEKASKNEAFVVGDPIEAGLCPLKLPRCLLVFPADSLDFGQSQKHPQGAFFSEEL